MDTTAELIEKLTIANIRLWMLQDIVKDEKDDVKCAEASRKVVQVNTHRAKLKKELDERFGEQSADLKLYGKNSPGG